MKIKFYYVKKDIWNLGITNTDTAMGNKVMLYDKERCICDLIIEENTYAGHLKYDEIIENVLEVGRLIRR